MTFPKVIESGVWKAGHCQGIAVDMDKGYIYYSFTTLLVKTDLDGNFIGSVTGLCGHLGCIVFSKDDGLVYGSLEYKSDSVGKGILNMLGEEREIPDRFYIAIFDVDKITEADMDSHSIMRCSCLSEVIDDYLADAALADGRNVKHRHGCSGIDGTAIGPMFGCDADSEKFLFVSYGVYGDTSREDNDYQVLLRYSLDELKKESEPLDQNEMHRTGAQHLGKYFVYTGNTVYGVQNLEYDPFTGKYFMAVYRGRKESFKNPPMFAVDASSAPERKVLRGVYPETEGNVIALDANGLDGYSFGYGQTGMASLGDGRFYFSCDGRNEDGQYTTVKLYRYENGDFLEIQ